MALDLTAYELSDSTTMRHVSGVREDEAEDGTLRTLDFSDGSLWDIFAVIEGLSAAMRDTLIDEMESSATDDMTVDMGTRNYLGRLRANTLGWTAAGGAFTVSFTLRASAV